MKEQRDEKLTPESFIARFRHNGTCKHSQCTACIRRIPGSHIWNHGFHEPQRVTFPDSSLRKTAKTEYNFLLVLCYAVLVSRARAMVYSMEAGYMRILQ